MAGLFPINRTALSVAEEKARAAVLAAGVTSPTEFDLELENYPYNPEENRAFNSREQ